MTRSRHRRSEGSGEPASLPSWAQRHLDEAGTTAGTAATTTHRRRGAGRATPDSPLRGWGVAILSVAAAVTAVPLAVSAVASDRSDDPLPTVDTFTAGAPQPLPGGESGTSGARRGSTEVAGDPATSGILGGPQAAAPGVPAPAPVVPVPLPAAVVRPTTPVVPTTITPREATPPPTTGTTTPTKTASDDDDGDGRSATKPTPKPTSPSKSTTSDDGGQKKDKGLLGNTTDAVNGVVGGLGRTASGLL